MSDNTVLGERLRAAIEHAATYLDQLEANAIRNGVDMLMDACDPPSSVAERLRAALSSPPSPEAERRWPEPQPMETAPKTGDDLRAKSFLGWCPDPTAPDGGDWRVCWWEPKLKGGIWYSDRDLEEHPTHWMPLPPVRKHVLKEGGAS